MRIKIFANISEKGHKFALIPFGLYFNNGIKKAQKGDVIVFNEGWRQVKKVLVGKCMLKVNTQIFTFFLKSLYRGWNVTDSFFAHWESVGISEGFGKAAFSRDEILLIEIKDLIDGELGQEKNA